MRNRKGFTLIELLAVLVVLSIILIIAVPTVSYLIKKQRRNYYESTDQNIQISVQDYFNSNRDKRPKGAYGRVTVDLADKLIKEDYIDSVVDADGKKTCSGYGMIINTGNKNYEYYTCIKCNCNNETCEYETDTTKVYNTVTNFCTDNYNPVAKIKTPSTIYLYNGRNDLFDTNKLVGKIYINLNNQDIDWKVSVPASNINDININQNNKYILNYSYEDSENEIPLITTTSDFIVYQYKAPKVDPIGFSWGSTIKDILKVTLKPDGILPNGVTTPKFKVSRYEVSYAIEGTDNWSEYKNISCTIDKTTNICTNGIFDISNLAAGNYKLKFRFKDTEKNISLETDGDYTFTIKSLELVCPTIAASIAKETWTKETVSLTITANDTFTSWEWLTNAPEEALEFISFGLNTGNQVKTLSSEGKRQGKIIIKNDSGETKECLTDKYWIDKSAPTCTNIAKLGSSAGTTYSNNTWVNQNIYTSAACSDSLSGCRSSNSRSVTTTGATTNETNSFVNSWTVYANGTSSLTWSVYDNVGNFKTCDTVMVKVDKVAPMIEHTISGTKKIQNSKWYTSNVTINFDFSDSVSGVDGNSIIFKENENIKALSKITEALKYKYVLSSDSLSTGNQYNIIIKDKAGNEKSLNLSKIFRDATPPVYSNKVTNFNNVYLGQVKDLSAGTYYKLSNKTESCSNGKCTATVNLQSNINNGKAVLNKCSSFGDGKTCKSLDTIYSGSTKNNFTDVTSGLSTALVPQPIQNWFNNNNGMSDCNTFWRNYTNCKVILYGYYYDEAGNGSDNYPFYEYIIELPTNY